MRIPRIAAFTCLLLAACQSSPIIHATPQPLSVLEDKVRKTASGEDFWYQLGTLSVPENRQAAESRSISVQFHRFARADDAPPHTPPIYLLRGGPGFAGLEGDLEREGYYEFYIEPYLAIADVVVVEHRGFGTLNALPCEPMRAVNPSDVETLEQRKARYADAAFACRDEYLASGVDLAGYNVREMVADVISAADVLGHDTLQVIGNSFGSHWAMQLVREHPTRVSRATLSALEGPDHTFDLPAEKQAALQRIANEAQRKGLVDPDGKDLLTAFSALVASLNDKPAVIEILEPANDKPVLLDIRGEDLREVVQGFSRGTTWGYLFPTWVADLQTMLGGDLDGAARRILYVRARQSMDTAAFISAECASGASPERTSRLRSQAAESLITNNLLFESGICEDWPAAFDDDFRETFVSDVPMVLMHGTYDTSTPFANAESFVAMFPQSHFIAIEGGSHGANIEAMEQYPAFKAQLFDWLKTGQVGDMPTKITLQPIDWTATL